LRCDISEALLIFNEILGKGFDGNHFISGLSVYFRDLLVSKDPQTVQLLDVGTETGEKYKTQAKQASALFLINALNISNECDLSYRESRNKRLLVELALIKICQLLGEKKKLNELEVPALKAIISEQQIPVDQQQTAQSPQTIQTTQTIQTSQSRPPSFSINNISTPPPETLTAPLPDPVPQPTPPQAQTIENESITQENLAITWKEFALTIPEEVRMMNFINSNTPVRITENEFEITVSNQLLEKELSALLPAFLNFSENKLGNNNLKINIKIDENTERQRVLSPEEHFRMWATENPALMKLQQNLNLEIN
jgi:DNA polymerase-3 subunit gamma/tau